MPAFWVEVTGCWRLMAANSTMKIGMVAETIVPIDAEVPATPGDWAT